MDTELLQAIGQMMDSKLESIKEDISDVKSRQDKLSADIATLNHEIIPKVNLLLEGMNGLQERNRQLDRLEAKQEDHDHRIFALEQNASKAQ